MPRIGPLSLALALFAGGLGAGGWLDAARALPGCVDAVTPERLAALIETIPAFAGRDARVLALESPRRRGHAGAPRIHACQGRLVTTRGAGALEYSIRPDARARDGARLHAELFQGGWRPALLPEPPRTGGDGGAVAAADARSGEADADAS